MGRKPTKHTKEAEEAILDAVSKGTPLAEICRELKIDRTIIYDWRRADPDFDQRFARARDIGFDAIAEDVLHIADDRTDEPASRRVRTDVRLKLLAKWDPKRYGEKLDLTSNDGSMTPKPALDMSKLSPEALKEIASLDPDA